jgi:hypothetical protein
MVRVYVIHCPLWCPERRPIIEENLSKRGFTDVVWVTGYPAKHPFVLWLWKRLGKHLGPPGISGLVKHLEAMRMFVNDPTSENSAIFCDDDCLFVKNWKEALEKIPDNFPFVNLSVGINFHILPDGNPRIIETNNGGCEAMLKSKEFCKFLLQNVDARCGMDHVYKAIMKYMNLPLICIPIVQQTSLLGEQIICENNESVPYHLNWFDFINNFKRTGISYEELCNESGIIRESS